MRNPHMNRHQTCCQLLQAYTREGGRLISDQKQRMLDWSRDIRGSEDGEEKTGSVPERERVFGGNRLAYTMSAPSSNDVFIQ